mmetsp:Transcript_17146/g.36816  ORF Transcript_17146/g.36816 Transcript_17146/m.36816 type:complete len:328 (-) Transcript_17146:68-1051(-)
MAGQTVNDNLFADPISLESALEVIEYLNRSGVRLLREQSVEEAWEHMQKAQEIIDVWDADFELVPPSVQHAWLVAKADTTSNIGIYHRKQGDHKSAISVLETALYCHHSAGSDGRMLAAAHLNIATCHLEGALSPHEAIKHAQAAIDCAGRVLSMSDGSTDKGTIEDDCTMLAVAYHKLAEAYEATREWSRSFYAYMQVYEVIKRSLGPNHRLAIAFEKSSRCPLPLSSSSPSKAPASARALGGGGSSSLAAYSNDRRPTTASSIFGAPSNRRLLPNLPRARASPPIAHARTGRYVLTSEVFQSWPPPSTSKEERKWYRLAQSGAAR